MCVMYVPSKNFFNSQHVAKRSFAINVIDGPLMAKYTLPKGKWDAGREKAISKCPITGNLQSAKQRVEE